MDEKSKRSLSVLSDILVVIVILAAVAVTVMAFSSRESGIPKLFGHSFMSVQSESMSGTFEKGDLIIVEDCNVDTLQEGDVVTFWKYSNDTRFLNTHRIVERIETEFEIYDTVVITYRTKGDNNEESDADILATRDIVGKWTGQKVPKLGTVLDFMGSKSGFLICVVVPIAVIFLFQLYRFIAILMENKKEAALEEIAEKTEEEKQRVIAEYLAMQKQQEGKEKAQSQSEEEKPKDTSQTEETKEKKPEVKDEKDSPGPEEVKEEEPEVKDEKDSSEPEEVKEEEPEVKDEKDSSEPEEVKEEEPEVKDEKDSSEPEEAKEEEPEVKDEKDSSEPEEAKEEEPEVKDEKDSSEPEEESQKDS